jgi:hypothetical protein
MTLSALFPNTPANVAERAGEVAPPPNCRHGMECSASTSSPTVSLMTNNLDKITQLSRAAIPVLARIPHVIGPGSLNHGYLETKAQPSGHLLYPNGVPES